MVDIGSIATAVGLASKAYDLSKQANVLDLQETMMKLREALVEAQEENLALRRRVTELETEAQLTSQLEYDGTVYWRIHDGKREGPFCPKCRDGASRLLARLTASSFYGLPMWRCNVCSADFSVRATWDASMPPPDRLPSP